TCCSGPAATCPCSRWPPEPTWSLWRSSTCWRQTSSRRTSAASSVRRLASAFALAGVLAAAAAHAAGPDPPPTLRPGHPRLYLTRARLDELRTRLLSDPAARGLYERLEAEATEILAEPTVRHELKGPRMLDQSRAVLRRVTTLAGLFLLDGDARKSERARAEMRAASQLADWNPSHFLDTAEMTAALGIGYDWLFAELRAGERALVR